MPVSETVYFFSARAVRLTALSILFFLLTAAFVPAQSQPGEYQLKAAFVYHFAQMVDWPPANLDSGRPLVICGVDDDAYATALDWAVDGKQIAGHPLQTRHVRDLSSLHGCQVLVIGSTDKSRVAVILDRVKDDAVLTIGDADNFAASGGIIGLALQEKKVRFDINLNAAQRVNLKISSRLLLLARNVIGTGRQG